MYDAAVFILGGVGFGVLSLVVLSFLPPAAQPVAPAADPAGADPTSTARGRVRRRRARPAPGSGSDASASEEEGVVGGGTGSGSSSSSSGEDSSGEGQGQAASDPPGAPRPPTLSTARRAEFQRAVFGTDDPKEMQALVQEAERKVARQAAKGKAPPRSSRDTIRMCFRSADCIILSGLIALLLWGMQREYGLAVTPLIEAALGTEIGVLTRAWENVEEFSRQVSGAWAAFGGADAGRRADL